MNAITMNEFTFSNLRQRFNDFHLNTQLLIILILMNVTDFLTTKIVVDATGFEAEANPLLLYLMSTTETVYAILWLKIIVFSHVCYMYYRLHKRKDNEKIQRRLTYELSFLNLVFFIVIPWNFFRVLQELSII